ncbi:MAG: FkbM family methyltransferase [Planctomycetota bacterium]|nr:FkbM family methyltransferase [Planctomycetota bacterium]
MLSKLLHLLPPQLAEKVFYRFVCGRASKSNGDRVQAKLQFANDACRLNCLRGDVIGDSLFYTGAFEPLASKELMKIATSEGGLLVDVGANIGYFTCLWASANQTNRCISVEASPRNIELLESNIHENGYSDRCELKRVAASNQQGEVSFDQGPVAQTGWGGLTILEPMALATGSPRPPNSTTRATGTAAAWSGSRVIRVPCVPLSELIPTDIPIPLLKIDVEGAEALVLEGAEKLFRDKRVKEVWFEDNVGRREKLGINVERLFSVLENNGYKVKKSSRIKSLAMDFVAKLSASN